MPGRTNLGHELKKIGVNARRFIVTLVLIRNSLVWGQTRAKDCHSFRQPWWEIIYIYNLYKKKKFFSKSCYLRIPKIFFRLCRFYGHSIRLKQCLAKLLKYPHYKSLRAYFYQLLRISLHFTSNRGAILILVKQVVKRLFRWGYWVGYCLFR